MTADAAATVAEITTEPTRTIRATAAPARAAAPNRQKPAAPRTPRKKRPASAGDTTAPKATTNRDDGRPVAPATAPKTGPRSGTGSPHTGRCAPASAPARSGVAVRALPAGRGGRLRSGQLRALVAQTLADKPDIAFTPTQLSNLLGRSAGAIANALTLLCQEGTAEKTTDKPKTYQAATPAHRS